MKEKLALDIQNLEVGHFVVEILEQTGQFNLTRPGHVKNLAVINNLKLKGVTKILIDPSKTISLIDQESDKSSPSKPVNKLRTQVSSKPVILEVKKAKDQFNKAKQTTRKLLDDIINSRDIDIAPVIDVIDNSIKMIYKNPDAMLCITSIREKDDYLLEHSVSVSVLMTVFAKYLDIDQKIVKQLAIGAFLHDIGKIKIPDEILQKPSKLTEAEFEVMKTHTVHSFNIIKDMNDVSEISLEVVAQHHEKLNGNGYPYQLTGEDISEYGKMISICDIFDALTADRVYKKGYTKVKAFSILRKLASQGDLELRLVDLFIKCIGIYPVGSLVELSSNKLAIVDRRNDEDPINPKVRCFYNSEYHKFVMTEDLDLSASEDFIVKGVRANDFDLDMNKIVEFLLMEG